MSKKPQLPSSQPASSDKKKPHSKTPSTPSESASKKADKEARKGNPLPTDGPPDRSPKQENL
jgi:hypothetical protein